MINNRKFTDPEGWNNPASSFYGKGNYGKPDRPGLSTEDMQKVLDEIPRTVIAPTINGIIDDLTSTTDGSSGADNIGATAVSGGSATTVQGILEEIVGGGTNLHAATADALEGYTIQTTLVSSNSGIPTAKAVADAMSSAGNGDMMKSTYDPTNVNGSAFVASHQEITDTHNFYTSTNVDGALDEIASMFHKITISTSDPTGGNDGDIWIKVT